MQLDELSDYSSDDETDMIKKYVEYFRQPASVWLIISRTNRVYQFWIGFEILCCLTSSYYYAYMSTFNDTSNDGNVTATVLVFETIFGLHILLKFFTEFKTDDSVLPVRDFGLIADNYLKNEFFIHLIPLIPLTQMIEFANGE